MQKRFTEKLAMITGAAGGLGRALALGFAAEGAGLILTDVERDGLDQTATLVAGLGGRCETHLIDLANEGAISSLGASICADHPRLDLLYNNAGIAYGEVNQPLDMISQERWLHYFAVNSIAPLLLGQALRPALAAAGGVIINQSSMAANVPANPYGVTKATLNSMTYGMANLFAPDGIRVNAIAPGLMETPASSQSLDPETQARIRGMQLLKAHGGADDIVRLALFLASDEARFITCEIVSCDGGNRLRGWRH